MIKILTYKTRKQIHKVKDKIINIILSPIRVVAMPIYKLYEKNKAKKRYSYKAIKKLVQYCIDYHLNSDKCIYVAFTDWVGEECKDYGVYGYSNLCDISWGWRGEHKRVKRKLDHIYLYQKDDYIQAVKELCGIPMTKELMKKEFTINSSDGRTYLSYVYYLIQDKEVCKISNTEE